MDKACLPEPPHIALQLTHQFLVVRKLLPPKERAIPEHPYCLLRHAHICICHGAYEPHPLTRRARLEP